MIYLDSSAVVKLVHREAGSLELVGWLAERPITPLVSSALVEVEMPRALRRHAPSALVGVWGVLPGCTAGLLKGRPPSRP